MLAGLTAGRTAISANPDGPLLLRVDDELHALDADGTLLTGPDGRRQLVRGEHARFPAQPGPHWLEDAETQVLAISS